MSLILFENCALLDANQPELLEGYQVLVEDGRIKEVSDKPIKTDGATCFDLKGRTLMPGLTDAHVHVTAVMANLNGMGAIPQTLITAKTIPIMEGMLMRGFTTVRDAGGADWGLAEAVEQGLIKAPRLLFSGHALSQTGGHGDGRGKNNNTEPCACNYADGSLSRLADGVDELRKAPTDHIANTQYSLEEIRAVVEEAEASRTYVMAHAYTARAIKRAVECGVRSIEHGNLIDAETAAVVEAFGAFVVPTMVTYEMLYRLGGKFGFPAVSLAKLGEVRTAAVNAIEICQKAGVKLGHGSDLLGEMHEHQSLEFSLKAEVLSPQEVIKCATVTNAELFNMSGEIGVIAAGAYADLLVVEGNPLKDLNLLQEQGRYFSAIMKEGQFYKCEL
jgi:imidazolonepropionase-like amidohydrolase